MKIVLAIWQPVFSIWHLPSVFMGQPATRNPKIRALDLHRKPRQSRRMTEQNLRVSYGYALTANFTYK
jgi:hypothetical protein